MKSTPESRYRIKEKRRFSGWRDLLASLHRRCRRSQRTLEVMRKALEGVEKNGNLAYVQDAIRRGN